MALESNVELKIVGWAEDHRWLVRKLQYIGRTGAPDRLFAGYGHCVFMEMKAPGEGLSTNQAREHNRLKDCGITVHVVDNVDDGVAILRFCMDNPISPLTFG